MTEEFNKSIVRRIWKDIWQEGNLAVIDELVDANHVLHAYPEDLDYGSGIEGFKRLVSTNRANLPDGQLTIEDLIAEDDKVVTRYTMRVPTAMTTGIWIDRLQDNRVVESWVDWDRLGFFRQLGLIPRSMRNNNEYLDLMNGHGFTMSVHLCYEGLKLLDQLHHLWERWICILDELNELRLEPAS